MSLIYQGCFSNLIGATWQPRSLTACCEFAGGIISCPQFVRFCAKKKETTTDRGGLDITMTGFYSYCVDTKKDITHLFHRLATTIVPESTNSRAWTYQLRALPSPQIDLLLLMVYLLTSLAIAHYSVRLCRALSRNKLLLVVASFLSNAWAFYGDTWEHVQCVLKRREIGFPPALDTSLDTYGRTIHFGLLSTGTTIYLVACLLLFRDMVLSTRTAQKVAAYFRLCIACAGFLWFGWVETIDADGPEQCRSLLSHLMHVVLTYFLFLMVVVTACGAVFREFRRTQGGKTTETTKTTKRKVG